MDVQRGFRDKIDKYLNPNQEISIEMNIVGNDIYDYSCFGVDQAGKLSDDRYMIFYNQTQSPHQEITYSANANTANFTINLNKLPDTIQKLVFTVSIDGTGTMGTITSHHLYIKQNAQNAINMNLNGQDFDQEKAIVLIEIYRKDGWRFAAIAKGFNGGLGDLLRAYGGEEAATEPQQMQPPAQSAPKKVSLEKKLQKHAPQLVSLAKPLQLEIEKRNLQDCIARVALVLDISGSMSSQYADGTVQQIVNKTLPLAVQFDDDGTLDFWYYGSRYKRMPSVTMNNYLSAVPHDWEELMNSLGYGNNEPRVMTDILNTYQHSELPVYVLLITDGGVGNNSAIQEILTNASQKPIFWQFVGVGGNGYGILEHLDHMTGRYVDNANFFALDDFNYVSNEELYNRLLNEFPQWLKEIKRVHMIS